MTGRLDARLRETLGVPGLAWLVTRIRERAESGNPLAGRIVLRSPTRDQRSALERLLGRRVRGNSLSADLGEIENLLRGAGLCSDLRDAVELVTGERLVDRRAERARATEEWARVVNDARRRIAGTHEGTLDRWLDEIHRTGLLQRVSLGDPARAATLMASAIDIVLELPAKDLHLAELAASVTGDSHALDPGMPLATLVLRAAALLGGMSGWTDNAERRAAWANVGVLCDDLSSAALTLGLSARGESLTDRALRMHAADAEPYRLSLRQLRRDRPQLDIGSEIFVCENPSVVSAAASRLRTHCAPLVCVEGQPSTAVRVLLDSLASGGATLRYHGDFDWAGIRIGNLVMLRHNAKPWRFDDEAYRAALRGTVLEGTPVGASWDSALTGSMSERAMAVHEEAVLDVLLEDLER